jgi:2-methylcitrate dehydratase PrpD
VAAAIEGNFGYLPLFETLHDLPPVLEQLGRSFAVTGLSIKPFPTGRAAHGGIAAVQTLMRDHAVAATDIAHMRYEAPSLIARLVGRPPHASMRVAYARLCLPYLAARTLFYGTAGLDAFSPEALSEPRVLELASRIDVTVDDNPDVAAFTPARLLATLRDGKILDIAVPALLGSPAAPLDEAARLAKIGACLEFGGVPLAPELLAARVDSLEHMHDVGELIAMTCLPA